VKTEIMKIIFVLTVLSVFICSCKLQGMWPTSFGQCLNRQTS